VDTSDVGAYYATFREREWQRLERDEGVVEFGVTTAMLARHLPESGRILDIGGPFYHLTDPNDRSRAAREAARVVRLGGVVFIALMPWLGFVRRTIWVADERRHLADPAFVAALRHHGVFTNDVPERFTHGYGVRPTDVVPFFESYGFATRTFVSTHGFANGIESALAEMRLSDPDAYAAALELLIDTADDPGLLGLGGHLLYVGERRAALSREQGMLE
jgi:hypothetical protein